MAERPVAAGRAAARLDTSVAIDGRIVDVVRAGFLHGQMLVPAPVLAELQGLADAGDDLRRAKGRRGLEVLETLRREPASTSRCSTTRCPGVPEVDAKLVRICLDRGAALLTLDTNLAKVAGAGRRPGDEPARAGAGAAPAGRRGRRGQRAAASSPARSPARRSATSTTARWWSSSGPATRIGDEVTVRVTSVLTTANGRMVFAQPVADAAVSRGRRAGRGGGRPGRWARRAPRRRARPRRCTCSAASRCSCHAVRTLAASAGRPRRRRGAAGRRSPRCEALLAGGPRRRRPASSSTGGPDPQRVGAAAPWPCCPTVRAGGARARRRPAAGPGRAGRRGGRRRRGRRRRRRAGAAGRRHRQAGRRHEAGRRDRRPAAAAGGADPAGLPARRARRGLRRPRPRRGHRRRRAGRAARRPRCVVVPGRRGGVQGDPTARPAARRGRAGADREAGRG